MNMDSGKHWHEADQEGENNNNNDDDFISIALFHVKHAQLR